MQDTRFLNVPTPLLSRAVGEMNEHGVILLDTAADLIGYGLDMHRVEEDVRQEVEARRREAA